MSPHAFVVSSTRPQLLYDQVRSFQGCSGGRRLTFYVFNDTYDNDEVYYETIARLHHEFKQEKLQVIYLRLAAQMAIIEQFSAFAGRILSLNQAIISDLFCENGRMQGIRSIQNKSLLIYYLLSKDSDLIVHRIDDDVMAYEAARIGVTVRIITKRNFFEQKEAALQGTVDICGSDYTIDSPSPLAALVDFLEYVKNFFSLASTRDGGTVIGTDHATISPHSVITYLDPMCILGPNRPPDGRYTYQQVLLEIPNHIRLLRKGTPRIAINDNNTASPVADAYFPGGCVSFRHGQVLSLTPPFGNQDLLWELIEFNRGKVLVKDGVVGHLKEGGNRESLMHDLTEVSYKHQTRATFAVFEYLKRYSPSVATDCFQDQFIAPSQRWISEADTFVEDTLRSLAPPNHWFNNVRYSLRLEPLMGLLHDYVNGGLAIRQNYSSSGLDGEKIFKQYEQKNKLFRKILRLAIARAT